MAKQTSRGATKSRSEKPKLKGSQPRIGAEGKKADNGVRDAKAARPARTEKAVPKPPKRRSKMSGLDAAEAVLSETGKPMNCKDLTEQVFAKGFWKTTGKTPAATIHAAMIREIKSKGKESRFRKVGRGTFAVSSVSE